MLKQVPLSVLVFYFAAKPSIPHYSKNNSFKFGEEELLEDLHISRSTFYRDKKKATTLFGVVLWGFALQNVLIADKRQNLDDT